MAGRIFISYRREDAAPAAGWLFDRLTAHFGPQQVVKDIDLVQPGLNAAEVIAAAVASCDVLLVLIGRQWLTATGPDGVRRLADPGDFVRLEIQSAMARGVQVIPVLVDGADLPPAGELPPSLAGLAREEELELSPNRAEADAVWLLRVLDQSIADRQATQVGSAGSAGDQRTITAQPLGWQQPAPAAAGPPPAAQPAPAQPAPAQAAPAQPGTGQPRAGQPGPGPTRTMRRLRLRTRTTVLIACGAAIAVAIAAFIVVPGSKPAPSAAAKSQRSAQSKTASSPSTASSTSPVASPKVIVTDNFSTKAINWLDDSHQTAGAYTGTGAYRLTVTGANGVSELARPAARRTAWVTRPH